MQPQSTRHKRLALLATLAVVTAGACAAPSSSTVATQSATATPSSRRHGTTTTTVKASPTTTAPKVTTTTAPRSTTTVPKATTTTAARTTTTASTTTTTGGSGGTVSHFSTLPPGSALPSDATCAAEVRPAAETRTTKNTTPNHTRGTQKNLTGPYPLFSRVDGNYVGTTDEIIQWAACKWGIDEDIIRAQAAAESWWDQTAVGDFQSDSTKCVPGHGIGADGHAGQCPASGGIVSLTYQYWPQGFPEAMNSTAYNLDYSYAWIRSCFEGQIDWLNTVDRVGTYAAGDIWGCVGEWFAGRWHTSAAEGYITTVKNYVSQKVWTTPSFLSLN